MCTSAPEYSTALSSAHHYSLAHALALSIAVDVGYNTVVRELARKVLNTATRFLQQHFSRYGEKRSLDVGSLMNVKRCLH